MVFGLLPVSGRMTWLFNLIDVVVVGETSMGRKKKIVVGLPFTQPGFGPLHLIFETKALPCSYNQMTKSSLFLI